MQKHSRPHTWQPLPAQSSPPCLQFSLLHPRTHLPGMGAASGPAPPLHAPAGSCPSHCTRSAPLSLARLQKGLGPAAAVGWQADLAHIPPGPPQAPLHLGISYVSAHQEPPPAPAEHHSLPAPVMQGRGAHVFECLHAPQCTAAICTSNSIPLPRPLPPGAAYPHCRCFELEVRVVCVLGHYARDLDQVDQHHVGGRGLLDGCKHLPNDQIPAARRKATWVVAQHQILDGIISRR
jgi:hypothetical protein